MLDEQLLAGLNFIQEGDSCVLASYGVAAYPFTRQPIQSYFSDYCRHFHIRNSDPVGAYLRHFSDYYTRRKITGYQLIFRLHRSKQRTFSRCRRKFSLSPIKDVRSKEKEVAAELGAREMNALMVFLNNENHSVVVFVGSGGLSFYQTRAGDFGDGLRSISELGELGEGLMLRKI